MKRIIDEFDRSDFIEFEKDGVKVRLDFYGWSWNKEKWITLTGSATILTININWKKIKGLVDFGMFQWWEKDQFYNEKLPFDLSKIDFVIVTHTHLDHIWKMLFLSKDEFTWKIWTTNINRHVISVMLDDIIKHQPENEKTKKEKIGTFINSIKWQIDKLWLNDKDFKELDEYIKELEEKYDSMDDKPKKEYFDKNDLFKLSLKINSVDYYEKVEVSNNIQLSFIKAWHLPGSSQAILKIKTKKGKFLTIWFSWDIWTFKNEKFWWKPDISKERFDIFVIESTYAWRYHVDKEKETKEFISAINDTIEKKWKIIIPAFVQWRIQEIALFLYKLIEGWKIKKVPIYFDSKTANKLNDIYISLLDNKLKKVLNKSFLKPVVLWKWKNRKNQFLNWKQSSIILSSWWMMSVWTISTYLHLLQDHKNLLVVTWFQAPWTIWHKIFTEWNRKIEVPWVGIIDVNAKLLYMKSFSWHWDQEDMLNLLKNMKFTKNAKIIINHWEENINQVIFWSAIKWIVWKTKEILLVKFNEEKYYNN